jgi:hypothetical protein
MNSNVVLFWLPVNEEATTALMKPNCLVRIPLWHQALLLEPEHLHDQNHQGSIGGTLSERYY